MGIILRYAIATFSLSAALSILLSASLFAQNDKIKLRAENQFIEVGTFTVKVPSSWKDFSATEATDLRQQYVAQSREIYRQFTGADDPSKSVDIAAFHFSDGAGTFAIVTLKVPPQSDLISLLKSQVKDKMAWGVHKGYIRKFLGLVPIDNDLFSGFYTKAIGKQGGVEVSGGLEHKELKNTIIQLTLLCPKEWNEAKATNTISSILGTVMLRDK